MHSPGPARSPEHLHFIDALRGWAFLGVLTVHCGQTSGSAAIRKWTLGGEYGVQLFFLLSALTLFRSLDLRQGGERHPWRNYFIRRACRILPLFWFGIVLYYFLEGSGPRPVAPDGLHAWHYVLTALCLHGWAPTSFNSVVPGGWSIAVEMTFYLVLPLLFRWVTNLWRALAAAFVALVAGVLVSQLAGASMGRVLPGEEQPLVAGLVSHWFPQQLPVFLLGAAIYFLWRDGRTGRFLAGNPARPATLVAAGLYGVFALGDADSGDFLPLHVLYALAFVPVILGLAARPYGGFVNPLTRTLGTLSFSAYLTHFAALQVVGNWLEGDWLTARVPPEAEGVRFLLLWLGTLVLTTLFSTATYGLIERPGMALGKALIRRVERPAALAEAGGAS